MVRGGDGIHLQRAYDPAKGAQTSRGRTDQQKMCGQAKNSVEEDCVRDRETVS